MAETRTIDLTPETAFDTEYIERMQAEGYTINDSAHARIILKDEQISIPEFLKAVRQTAKETLRSQPEVTSITITNESNSFKEVILPEDGSWCNIN